MSVPNGKMNPREREIGARLQAFREGIKYSQAAFAEILGLTRDQLAGIEYGRTPLKYRVAWQIRLAFGLSLDWLWGGGMSPDDLTEDHRLPHPDSARAGKNALLTEVFGEIYTLSDKSPHARKPRPIRLDPAELAHRWLLILALRRQLEGWIARIPEGCTNEFSSKLAQCAEDYLKSHPADSPELVSARLDGLLWEKMRADLARNRSPSPAFPRSSENHPDSPGKAKTLDTGKRPPEPALPRLLERLKRATRIRGRKAELAAWLGVHPQMVTDWLSGKQKPGGEITLQLLHWVQCQENS